MSNADLSNLVHVAPWSAINDGVMGGQSHSVPEIISGCLHFSGFISLENNGGFASIRSRQRHDLSGASGVLLRVLGDGRSYQFRLYTDAYSQGSKIAYSVTFDTLKDQWLEVPITFSRLKPVVRGRVLPGPVLDAGKVEEIGFLLADKQQGTFHLAVAGIRIM